MLYKRTLSSVVLVCFLFISVALSKTNWAFMIFICINALVVFGMLDFLYITNRNGSKFLRTYGIVTGVTLSSVLFFMNFFHQSSDEFLILGTVAILVGMFLIQLVRQDIKFSIHGICTTITAILYVVWLFSFLVKINYLREVDGRWIIFVLLLLSKSGDIFAYFVGSVIGKRKLVHRISPNKTVEGSIGGIIGSVLVAVFIMPMLPVPDAMKQNAWILGLILGFFGQLGDLAESMLKRNGEVKDSGEYIPGMGGVLDVLDSVLFNAPIMYCYMRYCIGVS